MHFFYLSINTHTTVVPLEMLRVKPPLIKYLVQNLYCDSHSLGVPCSLQIPSGKECWVVAIGFMVLII
jgi:hypothetical protein